MTTTSSISPSNQGAPQPAPTAEELREIAAIRRKYTKYDPPTIVRIGEVIAWACEQCAARIEAAENINMTTQELRRQIGDPRL